jgi:hypothetical protein
MPSALSLRLLRSFDYGSNSALRLTPLASFVTNKLENDIFSIAFQGYFFVSFNSWNSHAGKEGF